MYYIKLFFLIVKAPFNSETLSPKILLPVLVLHSIGHFKTNFLLMQAGCNVDNESITLQL